jgi:hypothetical protein
MAVTPSSICIERSRLDRQWWTNWNHISFNDRVRPEADTCVLLFSFRKADQLPIAATAHPFMRPHSRRARLKGTWRRKIALFAVASYLATPKQVHRLERFWVDFFELIPCIKVGARALIRKHLRKASKRCCRTFHLEKLETQLV